MSREGRKLAEALEGFALNMKRKVNDSGEDRRLHNSHGKCEETRPHTGKLISRESNSGVKATGTARFKIQLREKKRGK